MRRVVELSAAACRPGFVLGERYRLDHLIATGGMAQVWEATDEVLTRPVAVKVLHPHLAEDPNFLARFRAEAVAAARLTHPSIVAIFDTCTSDGVEAIVMERIRGTNLRRYLDERGPLEPAEAASIASHVAEALDTAHRAGIVHRDIKPANVLLSHDGRVLVTDFGIAKASTGQDITTTGMTLGTVKYLAPEQVEGGTVDARTDIYALGVVLYEMLCGRAPFVADTDAATALARLHQAPPEPRHVRAGIPRAVEDVVMKALAKDPDQRYQSASDFRAALLASVGGVLVAPNPVDDSAPPPPPAHEHDSTVAQDSTRFVQTERRWIMRTSIVVLIALAVGVAGVVFSRTEAGRDFFDTVKDKVTGSSPGKPLAIADVVPFDPQGGGAQTENNEDAPLAWDGDPATVWSTEGYERDRQFGNLKSGVGLVITVGQAADLEELVVSSPTKGWAAQVYVADAPATSLDGWGSPVAEKSDIEGDVTFDLGGAHGTVVLLWITLLGDDLENGKYRARIGEVSVTA